MRGMVSDLRRGETPDEYLRKLREDWSLLQGETELLTNARVHRQG